MQKELISELGFQQFVKEFKQLAEVEKPHWTKEKEIAAAFGDRSENAEYISAKEMLRNIDKRLRFLEKIINNSEVIALNQLDYNKVTFGACVELLDLNTQEIKAYCILGTYETNPAENIISNKSPLGQQLLGKEVGECIELSLNNELFEYEILSISPFLS